jgi:hypothetical protein
MSRSICPDPTEADHQGGNERERSRTGGTQGRWRTWWRGRRSGSSRAPEATTHSFARSKRIAWARGFGGMRFGLACTRRVTGEQPRLQVPGELLQSPHVVGRRLAHQVADATRASRQGPTSSAV